MKTIIFNNEINLENINDLIQQIDTTDDICTVYFSGYGYDYNARNILIDYLSIMSAFKTIVLKAFNKIENTAFEIFYKCSLRPDCKIILPNTIGKISKYEYDLSSFEDRNIKNEIDKENKELMVWYSKTSPSQKQLKELKTGVYYEYTELQTILENYRDQIEISL